MNLVSVKSIRDLPPLETGGIVARQGFGFQDHVAAKFCISMLTDPSLLEVWCETQDDITLIWFIAQEEVVEFVQVKNTSEQGLWTKPNVSTRDKVKGTTKVGTSILERLLANDRCTEPNCFRLVTSYQVSPELKVLQFPLTTPERAIHVPAMQTLATYFASKVGDFKSANGNGYEYWLEKTLWEVEPSSPDLWNKNVLACMRYISSNPSLDYMLVEQVENSIYKPLLLRIQEAAQADPITERSKKIITRSEIIQFIHEHAVSSSAVAPIPGDDALERKLKDAQIPTLAIHNAQAMRMQYRQQKNRASFTSISDFNNIELEVRATLTQLRAEFDAGALGDDSLGFHATCLHAIQELADKLSIPSTTKLALMQGCMYYITGRCWHQFERQLL